MPIVLIFLLGSLLQAATGEWPFYGGDAGGMKYSALNQINRDNVSRLVPVWTWHSRDMHRGAKAGLRGKQSAFETTPLYIDGTLYATTAFGRVVALDPLTGQERWAFDPHVDPNVGYGDFANRGVAAWRSGKDLRLFIATIDARLIALDAGSGKPAAQFGKSGQVDLRKGLRLQPRTKSEYEETSPPVVIGDLVVVGSAIADNQRADMASGEVRAYNVRTGKLAWTFDPLVGTKTGAGNAWSVMSVDEARGLVFVPTGSPSPDYYGGMRKGNNSYANSVVALDAKTGNVRWSFQTVHHDLWDYDVASQPAMVTVNGRSAVAVGSKTGNLFLLDRETGSPLFGVEERAAPRSDVPGEESSQTQPYPKLPAHLGPTRFEAWGPNEEERKWCADTVSKLRDEGMFTPPSLRGSLVFPGNVGGMAWGGVAFDPSGGTLFVPYNRLAAVVRLVPQAELAAADKARPDWETSPQKGTPFGMQRTFLLSPKGSPCTAPPWGVMAAIDANTGALKWEVPVGSIPFAGNRPELGSIALGGPIATAGKLVFLGATLDPYLKAYDSETGKELWRGALPTSARAIPMTFLGPDGKQYVVIAAGGHDVPGNVQGDELVVFGLK